MKIYQQFYEIKRSAEKGGNKIKTLHFNSGLLPRSTNDLINDMQEVHQLTIVLHLS